MLARAVVALRKGPCAQVAVSASDDGVPQRAPAHDRPEMYGEQRSEVHTPGGGYFDAMAPAVSELEPWSQPTQRLASPESRGAASMVAEQERSERRAGAVADGLAAALCCPGSPVALTA